MANYDLKHFHEWLKDKNRHPIMAAKAHLIGYMEEYLLVEHGQSFGNASNIYERLHNGEKYIEIRYNQLAAEIQSADKRR